VLEPDHIVFREKVAALRNRFFQILAMRKIDIVSNNPEPHVDSNYRVELQAILTDELSELLLGVFLEVKRVSRAPAFARTGFAIDRSRRR